MNTWGYTKEWNLFEETIYIHLNPSHGEVTMYFIEYDRYGNGTKRQYKPHYFIYDLHRRYTLYSYVDPSLVDTILDLCDKVVDPYLLVYKNKEGIVFLDIRTNREFAIRRECDGRLRRVCRDDQVYREAAVLQRILGQQKLSPA